MNDEINYKNNPLHGVTIKTLISELVDYYGFEILFAYLNINCFKSNPSIASSIKFLKKTDWAREKVESFYLYEFKNLPRATTDQFALPPRDRIIPEDQKPGEPAKLSLEDAEHLQKKREIKSSAFGNKSRTRSVQNEHYGSKQRHKINASPYASVQKLSDNSPTMPELSGEGKIDPWAKWRK